MVRHPWVLQLTLACCLGCEGHRPVAHQQLKGCSQAGVLASSRSHQEAPSLCGQGPLFSFSRGSCPGDQLCCLHTGYVVCCQAFAQDCHLGTQAPLAACV